MRDRSLGNGTIWPLPAVVAAPTEQVPLAQSDQTSWPASKVSSEDPLAIADIAEAVESAEAAEAAEKEETSDEEEALGALQAVKAAEAVESSRSVNICALGFSYQRPNGQKIRCRGCGALGPDVSWFYEHCTNNFDASAHGENFEYDFEEVLVDNSDGGEEDKEDKKKKKKKKYEEEEELDFDYCDDNKLEVDSDCDINSDCDHRYQSSFPPNGTNPTAACSAPAGGRDCESLPVKALRATLRPLLDAAGVVVFERGEGGGGDSALDLLVAEEMDMESLEFCSVGDLVEVGLKETDARSIVAYFLQ